MLRVIGKALDWNFVIDIPIIIFLFIKFFNGADPFVLELWLTILVGFNIALIVLGKMLIRIDRIRRWSRQQAIEKKEELLRRQQAEKKEHVYMYDVKRGDGLREMRVVRYMG